MSLDQTIKQRLIGAIVLVAIAVVFLPGILGQKKQQQQFESKIPPQPKSQQTSSKNSSMASEKSQGMISSEADTAEQTREKVSVNSKQASNDNNQDSGKSTKVEQPKTEQRESPKTVTLNKSKTGETSNTAKPTTENTVNTRANATKESEKLTLTNSSYVVQVGSFSSHANADILAKRLEDEQLKSFVRPFKKGDGQVLYRVYVGPWLNKQSAERQLNKIADITRLKPIVVKWDATRQ